jgi:hypothetical protein
VTRLIVSEWHRPPDQIAEFGQMLAGEVEYSFFFCWSDGMVPGFGLIENDAALAAFQSLQLVEVNMTLEQAETAADWALGKRWNNLPIEDWGNGQRAGWYEYGVAIQKGSDVWQLPHVGEGGHFRLVPA